jgi:hypothetical protein
VSSYSIAELYRCKGNSFAHSLTMIHMQYVATEEN